MGRIISVIASLAVIMLGAAGIASATEQPFVPVDTAAGGAQTDSTVSSVTSDTVILVQDGRATATAGTSAETANLGIEVAAGDTITVDYALSDGATSDLGAVRLFIYYSADADTWNQAPDQFVAADSDSGTLSITADGGTIGTAGVVYDTSNPSTGTATFSGLTVVGEAVPFLPVAEPEPEPCEWDDELLADDENCVEPEPDPDPKGGDELNCDDFTTQEEAQAVLDADPSDPNVLDGDGNGVACESLPSGVEEDDTEQVAATGKQLPKTGIETWQLAALSLALLLIGGAMVLLKRPRQAGRFRSHN